MNKTKKLIALTLAAVMAFSFVACNRETGEDITSNTGDNQEIINSQPSQENVSSEATGIVPEGNSSVDIVDNNPNSEIVNDSSVSQDENTVQSQPGDTANPPESETVANSSENPGFNSISGLSVSTVIIDANWEQYAYINGVKYNYGTPVTNIPLYKDNPEGTNLTAPVVMDSEVRNLLDSGYRIDDSNIEKNGPLGIQLYMAKEGYNGQPVFNNIWFSAPESAEFARNQNNFDRTKYIGLGSSFEEACSVLGQPTSVIEETTFEWETADGNMLMLVTAVAADGTKLVCNMAASIS